MRLCERDAPGTGGPPYPTGMTAHESERLLVRGTNTHRTMRLWTLLRGSSSDFDDLTFAVAETLGWCPPPDADFCAALNGACEFTDTQEWRSVRRAATQVFFERYDAPDDACYDETAYDWRTWDERVVDVHFDEDVCRWCQMGVPGDFTFHREVSKAVACGRRTIAEVADIVNCPLPGQTP